jgi:hypothetical protein
MFDLILGGVVGLVVGWNLLPQPKWASDLWHKIFG